MGTLAANPSTFELAMLVAFGVMGYLMRCWDYPLAPMIVGLILGPMAESQFRRALQISLGDPWVFFKHGGSATLLAIAAARPGGALDVQGPASAQGRRRLGRNPGPVAGRTVAASC